MFLRFVKFPLKVIKKIVNKMVSFIKKITKKEDKLCYRFLHLGDLLTKQGSEPSGGQYIILSRIIDVENYRRIGGV